MGLRIFLHSVRLVFNQLSGALRVSAVLYLLLAVLSAVGSYFLAQSIVGGELQFLPWQAVLAGIISGILYLWIAIAWHRYVLLDELPNALIPPFRSDRFLAYVGRSLQVLLLGVVIGAVIGVVNGILLAMSGGSPIMAVLGSFLIIAVVLLISYRLAPIFPGAAIGQRVGIGQAWAATRGTWGTIIMLAVISTIATIIIDLPTLLIQSLPIGQALTLIWTSVTGWIKLMVGVSILTTLYGVYVEKRPIAD